MVNQEFGDEIWMRSEPPEKRIVAPAKGDKSKELGVFCIGLGVILAALMIYAAMLGPSPAINNPPPIGLVVLTLIPSLVLMGAGVFVYFDRSKWSVKLASAIVTLAFVGQALLSWNVINWIFSAVCLYLVWRTAEQASQQLDRRSRITEH